MQSPLDRNRLGAHEGWVTKHERALRVLQEQPWAADMLRRIDEQGGVRNAPAGLLFELRFAYELARHCQAAGPRYEYHAGVGDSTIDFALNWAGQFWLLELVSIEESRAVRGLQASSRSMAAPGVTSEAVWLCSDAGDAHESPWGELVRVAEKLQSKVWDSALATPQKFPVRSSGQVNVVVVNMVGFEGSGDPDAAHCREIALGGSSVAAEQRTVHESRGMTGLFEPSNSRRGAVEFRSRVDMIGFVAEHPAYERDDEIARNIYLVPNPARSDGRELVATFPVRAPAHLRNPLGLRE